MSLRYVIEPRISETNATGHIDHTVVPLWLETARTPIYRMFNPALLFTDWNTVIRKIDIEFMSQIFYEHKVEVRTRITDIGNTSFQVEQELWQEDRLTARGRTVIVCFDYELGCKAVIPDAVRIRLHDLLEDNNRDK